MSTVVAGRREAGASVGWRAKRSRAGELYVKTRRVWLGSATLVFTQSRDAPFVQSHEAPCSMISGRDLVRGRPLHRAIVSRIESASFRRSPRRRCARERRRSARVSSIREARRRVRRCRGQGAAGQTLQGTGADLRALSTSGNAFGSGRSSSFMAPRFSWRRVQACGLPAFVRRPDGVGTP